MTRSIPGIVLFVGLALASAARADQDCHIGSYRLSDGRLVDISPDDGPLRWRQFDGKTGSLHKQADGSWQSTYGWTDRKDGITVTFPDCATIAFDKMRGNRIAFDVQDTTFTSHGTRLAGRLVMPKGNGKVPVVVMVHGAENVSARIDYYLQRLLPAEGVGVFVFDKRGTGGSGGQYTQDFSLLGDDAVAALHEAKRLAGARLGRIGYQGGSQGGWIGPIAANREPVDFVIASFGLAVSVIDEDQEAVEIQLREKGYTPEEIRQAQEVASAAEAVFESAFTRGFKEFDAVRAKYKNARWYKDLEGDFTFMLLPYSEAQLRAMAAKYDWHTPFRYDPMATLRASTTPQLWIVGGEDYQAPSAETSRRIKSLIAEGHPFTLASYPHAEHGMTLFETDVKGERVSTVYEPGYFKMMRDFARDGRLSGSYGDATITPPRAVSN